MPDETTLKQLFCPIDFSPTSETALVHALRLAQLTGGWLTVFHPARARAEVEASPDLFAQVRARLTVWGVLLESTPSGGHPGALGFLIKRVEVQSRDPLAATIEYLHKHECDLMVLSRQRIGPLSRRSMAEPLARKTAIKALVFPDGVSGFVAEATGRVMLERVLIPVDPWPKAREAIASTLQLVDAFRLTRMEVTLLRTGSETSPPQLELPDDTRCIWNRVKAPGEAGPEILRVADKTSADVIIMPADDRRGSAAPCTPRRRRRCW